MFVIADDTCECWCAGELKLKSTCISYLSGFESKQTNHNINSKNISQMTNESTQRISYVLLQHVHNALQWFVLRI